MDRGKNTAAAGESWDAIEYLSLRRRFDFQHPFTRMAALPQPRS